MLTPEQAVLASILICVGGAVLTLLVSKRKTVAGVVNFAVVVATAILIFSAAGKVLFFGPSAQAAAFWPVPQIGFALRLYVDGLTAFFLLLAALIAVPASLYSIVYMRHYRDYGVHRYYPHFLLFLGAMYGLLSTTDMMWFFFIFWQMMTLPGYALIRFERKQPQNIRAANKYLVMMQIACAATMLGAEILAVTGAPAGGGAGLKYDFDTVSANLPALLTTNPGMTALAFGLFLAGFGIKMGMWPFGQVWLPDAHPAAPSPVSAMLSGVMIKTGVYGLLRYFLWLVPATELDNFPLARWGMVITILGTVTLFTGTMQALKQEQSKRLLAFSSIGQIGYILLGAGACMALLSTHKSYFMALGGIALLGALFHVLNHGLFKALLFLNAGSLFHATGTQDLNKMGGLMKFMPLTAVTALVASFSISGVPLFNGFASKWNIYVACVEGGAAAKYLPVCALIAILTSALTLAVFIKFFGVSFLSRTSECVRARADESGRLEVGWTMQLPQVLLALFCVLLGLVPIAACQLVQHVLNASRQGLAALLAGTNPISGNYRDGLEAIGLSAVYMPVTVAVFLALAVLVVRFIFKAGGARRRAAVPWLCGYAREAECHRFASHHFYGEFKRCFRWLGGGPGTPRTEDSLHDRARKT